MAKAETEFQFEYAITTMRNLDAQSIEWFGDVGFEKIAMIYSVVCGYGVVTSNNAESSTAQT